MEASSLDNAISILENSISDSETCAERLELWLPIVTGLVVVGVALEVIEIFHERREERRDWTSWHGSFPKKPSLIMFGLKLAGAILVTVGVASELGLGVLLGNRTADIRNKTTKLVGLVKQKSAVANESAERAKGRAAALGRETEQLRKSAEDEKLARIKIQQAVAWRSLSKAQQMDIGSRLKAFSGQFTNCQYLANDMEAFSFSSDIAAALRTAKWQVIPPSQNVLLMKQAGLSGTTSPVERLDSGVEVRNTPDVRSLLAARAIAKELQRLGFDATNVSSIEQAPVPTVWIIVDHRPRGAQGEAKLRSKPSKQK